jgi:hypothetical protein
VILRTAGSALALGLCLAAQVRAQVPVGGQFQVNGYTTGSQSRPSVAMAADGTFVVAWASEGSPGSDTSAQSIQAQRYAANGSPLGAQFQVNTYTTSFQRTPNVAATPDGRFVVVWLSEGSSGTDNGSDSIQGQRYAADGLPLGAQFQVNDYTLGDQSSPSVATSADGSFVVVWDSEYSPGTDSSETSVHARRFGSDGSPQVEFQVNSFTTGYQYTPSVAAASGGGFVVVWESYGSYIDPGYLSIQAQRFDSAGSPQGAQFQVNTYTTLYQSDPRVAAAADGRFVVAWWSEGSSGTDSNGSSTQARRYDATGVPQGAQFQVNTYTTGDQYYPSVATSADGSFVVAWESRSSPGTDTSNLSIQGQRFGAGALPLGSQFQINTYTTSIQGSPAVAANDEKFVVAWLSVGSSGSDSSGTSIQGQRYSIPLEVPALSSAQAALCALGLLATSAALLRARRRN